MSSTFGSFEAAKSGLSVSMQQLNVTEQNITNVNTPGYTRQRLLTSAKEPTSSAYLIAELNKAKVGQGVETTGIQQIRSSYLDQQFRNLNTNYSYSNSRSDALTYLDGLFNELNDDSSLTKSIDNFFSALNTFSSDTSTKEYRTNVQKQAEGMTESFRNVYEEMQSLWNDQNDNINTMAQKINSLAQKISSLNDAIARSEQTGATANDLNDERNYLIDELSGYVDISYAPNPKNSSMVDVSIGGMSLVSGRTYSAIDVHSMTDLAGQVAALNADTSLSVTDRQTAIQAVVDQMNAYYAPATPVTMTASTDAPGEFDITYKGKLLVEAGVGAVSADAFAGGDVDLWTDISRNRLTLVDGTTSTGHNLDIGASGAITGGQLYSNIEMVTSNTATSPGIPFYMDQLNNLVRDIAKNINDIHQTGYTYPDGVIGPGHTTDSTNDVIFFNATAVLDAGGNPVKVSGITQYDYSSVTAGNFRLSDEVEESVYNIAGSSQQVVLSDGSTQSGNNDVALLLSKDLTNHDYYKELNSIVGNLAITSNTSDSITSTKKSLLDSVDTQRKSISSVSLDEETTNLIVFQQSYNAAARVITTLDDMLNTMINKMGIS